jgi:hypothetical protein
MNSSNKQIAGVILGVAAGWALYKFFSMPDEERHEFVSDIKRKTNDLLDDAEDTVEKVEQYISEINSKGKGEWIDKLYILKKMFRSLYGSDKRYLL